MALLRTADVVRRRVSQAVEAHGITVQQFNVLRILRGAEPAGLPTLEIGTRLVEQTPGVTRLLDRLEKKGLVARARGTDRRQVFCKITEPGLALLSEVDGPVLEANEESVKPLSGSDRKKLLSLLQAVREG